MHEQQPDAHTTPAHVMAMGLPVFKRSVQRSGMSPESFVQALTRTSLSTLVIWSQLDLETLLLAAERHGLDPLGREVFLVREGDSLDGQRGSSAPCTGGTGECRPVSGST